jgi:hypothetical protein
VRLSYRYNGRMRQELKVNPDSLCSAVTHIEVEIMRPCAGSLVLSYLVIGSIGDVRIPAAVAAARTDELWRHTCFEAFVCNLPGPAYYEFNFAPSTQWAAYRFDSYRSGIRAATEISAPRIEVQSSRANGAASPIPCLSTPTGSNGTAGAIGPSQLSPVRSLGPIARVPVSSV